MSANSVFIKYLFIIILLFTSSSVAFALNLTSDASQFINRISPSEGLTQSYVTKTVQDEEGFIWIGTQMGLNRYDGYNIKEIKGPNKVFEKGIISTLFIDEKGFLWVSTEHSGLYRMNTTTFASEQFFSGKIEPDDKSYSQVSVIKQGRDDTLWLGISNNLYQLEIASQKLTHYLTLETEDDIVRDIYIEGDSLYCASSDGLYKVAIKTGQSELIPHRPSTVKSIDSANTKLLIYDNQLGLLVGTVDGLYSLPRPDSNTDDMAMPQLLIPNLNIWDMIWMNGYYFVATDQGLYRFNPTTLELTFVLNFSESIYRTTDNNILDIFQDRSGNMWLASKSQGVMIWSPLTTRFGHVGTTTKSKLSNENVWAIHQDNSGTIWVGTNNGINELQFDSGKITAYLTVDDLKKIRGMQVVRNIFANSTDDNLLWVLNDEGFFLFDKTTGVAREPYFTKEAKNIIQDKWLSGLFVIDNENIFFFNESGHLHYNSTTGEINRLTELDQFTDVDLSWSFIGRLPDKDHTVLLATSGHLYQYDWLSKSVSLIYKVKNYQQQSFDTVDNWVIDKNNTLWLAMTGEGLIGLDYDTFDEKYRFDASNQLTTNNIYSLQLDEFGNLWFSSQLGIFYLDIDTLHIENFVSSDGLHSNEFNGYAFTKLKDNRLVFGSQSGITVFSPKEFQKKYISKENYRVSLTHMSLISDKRELKKLHGRAAIELEHDDIGLKLQFSTLQFFKQAQTTYNIELFGPSPLSFSNYESNELLIPKLDAGEYKLKITATNPQTGITSLPLSLKIHSKFAPWASPKAKLGIFMILASILAVYFYNRRLRKIELIEAHDEAQSSKEQMQLALKGSNSGVWDYQILEDKVYEERVGQELGYSYLRKAVSMKEHALLIKPEQFSQLKLKWKDFINGIDDNWDVSYQMKSSKGEWYWYRDVGRVISRDVKGLPTRVSGTYTNITQTKVNEAQAILFGEAFSQINDWVLILDVAMQPVTTNEAFMKAFGLDNISIIPSLKLILSKLGEQKYQKFKEIIEQIKPKASWQGEEVIETATSDKHPVLIKINAIAKNQKISHYVIVISDITMQKHAEEKLRHLAHYDYLTDLPNRKLILEMLEEKVKFPEKQCALFFIDLDKFKQVNDLYGHVVGDNLLKFVAKTLVGCVKHYDIVARQSGDEFMILFDSYNSIDDLSHIAQRINTKLSKPIVIEGNHLNITSSIGISIFPNDSRSATGLIKKADLAMIHAKQESRGNFQFFTRDMNEKAHQRLFLENELRKACDSKCFTNFYQPIVNQVQEKVIGFELLLRWQHEGEMISPSIFIPIAEEIGLISQMTEDAIDQALADYCLWKDEFPESYISVNLSPIHILQEGLGNTIDMLLNKHQLPASTLRLEITEGTLLADLDVAMTRLNELQSQGFKLLLDDFGTGYSSLTYLSKFPVNVLKIDKSFVLNLKTNPMNKPIIKSIISLANNLGLSCIAEGVETKSQLMYLQGLGCEAIQGFYFSKPLPVEEVMLSAKNIFKEATNQ